MTQPKKPAKADEAPVESKPDAKTNDVPEEAPVDRGRTVAAASKRFGMKEREIIKMTDLPEGTLVVTHDGYPTLWCDDDSLVYGYKA